MKLSTIATRAAQQKYLQPAERALYKFVLALVILIPSGTILGGLAAVLASLHASAPAWLWQTLAVLLPAALMAAAKYYTAQGDTQVGALLQQFEAGAAADVSPPSVPPIPPTPRITETPEAGH